MKNFKKVVMLAMLGVFALGIAGTASAQPWTKKIKAARARLKVMPQFGREAVWDRETGLLWQLQPSTTTMSWESAVLGCQNLKLGDRMGWRLPTVQELATLVDPTQSNPALPAGHPFLDIQSDHYWTTNHWPSNTDGFPEWARTVSFGGTGFVSGGHKPTYSLYRWCVRGGSGHNSR